MEQANNSNKEFHKRNNSNLLSYIYLQTDAIPSPDVELNILHHRLKDSASLAERREIAREIEELLEVEYDCCCCCFFFNIIVLDVSFDLTILMNSKIVLVYFLEMTSGFSRVISM